MKKTRYKKAEAFFFVFTVILNLIPVLQGAFFPTLDGAAHLYNSNLVNILALHKNEVIRQFFILNHEPVPNWSGHAILAFFNLFFSGAAAEKVLLLFYLIALPFSFRALIKTLAPGNELFSYFIFPFTYSYVFFLGFYNFSLAIIFMLLTLNYWIKNETGWPVKKTAGLFALIALTYFSHIFVFAVTLLLIGLYVLIRGISDAARYSSLRKELVKICKSMLVLAAAALIPFLLFCYYFLSRSGSTPVNTFLPKEELIGWIKTVRPVIALHTGIEEPYTRKLFYLISGIFIIGIYNRIEKGRPPEPLLLKTRAGNFFKDLAAADFLILGAAVMLFLCFKLPDSDGTAGYVSVRLCLLFFLFLVLWLAMQNFPRWLGVVSIACIFYFSYSRYAYYCTVVEDQGAVALSCNKAADYIAENSIVLPLNYSDNWLNDNFADYLGTDKPMVILKNYEATTGYFPVKATSAFLEYLDNRTMALSKADYVFVLGSIDAQLREPDTATRNAILTRYKQVYVSPYCRLYKNTAAKN